MKTAELVFIPAWSISHFVPMMEMAKLFVARYEQLSVTILFMKYPVEIGLGSYIESLLSTTIPHFRFLEVPQTDPNTYMSKPPHTRFSAFIETQKAHVRDIVFDIARSETTQFKGCIIDLFCITLADIADELNVPSYVFSAPSASFLGLMFHLHSLVDEHNIDITEYKDSDAELFVPSYTNPVPAKVLPSVLLDKEGGSALFVSIARRLRETKGIVVNTFMELESHALKSLAVDSKIPVFYPVGPVLNLTGEGKNSEEKTIILRWLDEQPPSSVVFMCFGSFGSFQEDQVKKIALALERSKHHFLWSLRPPRPKDKTKVPLEYSNLEKVIPPGFLERTAGIGKVIGWAPQVSVLSHQAVGGFVSHCGWNSILESLWFGVPMGTWPLYAEQQMNAFKMVNELGIAVDIKIDYRNDHNMKTEVIVRAEEIESKIMEMMMDENRSEMRMKVKEMKEKSRLAVMEKGSSYAAIGRLIEEIIM